MEPQVHILKTWPEFYQQILDDLKSFELREFNKEEKGPNGAPRDFQVGDSLLLEEYNPISKEYTGRALYVQVTSILRGGQFNLAENMCIMSIRKTPFYTLDELLKKVTPDNLHGEV